MNLNYLKRHSWQICCATQKAKHKADRQSKLSSLCYRVRGWAAGTREAMFSCISRANGTTRMS